MFLVTISPALVMMINPLIARLRFGAGEWQSFLMTAALPTSMLLSVFWSEVLARMSARRYLLVYWLFAAAPVALAAAAHSFWHLLACQLAASVGMAGWAPIHGTLLKRLYTDRVRGRVHGALIVPNTLSGVVALLVAGAWLTADGEAFRIFLPVTALLHFAGVTVLMWLAGPKREKDRPRPHEGLRSLMTPVLNMRRTLAEDRAFYRYEAAFMTYGAGFMICEVLFPVLVTDKLNMNYDEVAKSAHVVVRLSMLALAFPMGILVDRLGPSRTCAAVFLYLALYPIGLGLAAGPVGLAVASAIFGSAMAGVMHGWMLGPVAMAPTAERVAQYVSIHSTLVGLRGIVFQGVGMLLYTVSGAFYVPLIVAALCFVWAARQMWRLGRRPGSDSGVPAPPSVDPREHAPVHGTRDLVARQSSVTLYSSG